MLTRRTMLAALSVLSTPGRSHADDTGLRHYPSRPVVLVVPYPPGGSVDSVGRILAAAMGQDLGVNVVVENRGGAAGSIASTVVARAEPDGHTLVLGTQQTHATNPSLLAQIAYDPVKDFAPVAGLAVIPHLIATRNDLGVSDVRGLIALARSRPQGLIYGSTGQGSSSQLATELFRMRAGIERLVHVPFRGAGPMVQELIAGRIDFCLVSIPSVVSFVEAGSVKALAVARARRIERMPDLPAITEAGMTGVDADAWFALFAPARTPPPIIERLFQAVSKTLRRDDIRAGLAAQGVVIALTPGSTIASSLPSEIARWAEVVKAAGVKPE